jgi:acetate kinase
VTHNPVILVVNCGSSSVKFALFTDEGAAPRRLAFGSLERLGLSDGRFSATAVDGGVLFDETRDIPNHVAALDMLLSKVEEFVPRDRLRAVGHRVVHGGPGCDCPMLVTPTLEAQLRNLIPLAPLHQPHNLAGILAVRVRRPDLPQIAAFDTAFHDGLPRLAQLTGLPRRFEAKGVRRFGYHGLSYEYIVEHLRHRAGGDGAAGRLVIAHLGNGASMAAIRDGHSVETTMGFSTLAGLPMGTRSGDIDPGIVLYLQAELGMTAEEVQTLLYQQSGLLGLSGLSRNMRDLLAQAKTDPAAAEAIDFYCHRARKHLAALTAALGGLDRIVFTGGIGANAPVIRAKICEGLGYLGVEIDTHRNADGEETISGDQSRVVVEALPTDEELMIARHVQRALLAQPQARRA